MLIDKVEEEIFHAKLVLNTKNTSLKIDARVSDALALRAEAPVFISSEIILDKGFKFEERSFSKEHLTLFNTYNLKELETMLSETVAKEDYKRASLLRDVIDRKKERL